MVELPAAAGGVIHLAGRVVLLQKVLNDEWRLPKGHLHAGETPLAGALREVAEETGYADLLPLAPLGCERQAYRGAAGWVERPLQVWLLTPRSWSRRTRSARDARRFRVHWLPLEVALERISFAAERLFLERAAVVAAGLQSAVGSVDTTS
ncbi:MAG: NUDIX domain-containing protein [Fimbriimonadaceae bacterium]|nr:NUDIX domain-containing protein [Fimbriimonadaceae bacterium]